jgi:hypothetical protein
VARLVVRKGEKAGTEYGLESRSLILGRSKSCDIQVPSVKASRRHAEIFIDGGQHFLRDLDSANGTRLNGHELPDQERLYNGDRISIGHNVLEFVDPGGTARPEPVPEADTVCDPRRDEESPAGLVEQGASDYRRLVLAIGAILALGLVAVLVYVALGWVSGGPTRAESGSPPAESAPVSAGD